MTIQEEHKQAILKSEFETERHSAIYDYDIDVASQSCAEITKKHAIGFKVGCSNNVVRTSYYKDKRYNNEQLFELYLNQLPT